MSEITATVVGAADLRVKLDSLSGPMRDALRELIPQLQTNVVASIQELLSGELLRNRSNRLRDGISAGPITETDTSIDGTVGTNAIYAAIQNFGGTITPKTVSNLTIPLDAVLTANGVARYSARDIIGDPSIGGFSGTFFRNNILFGKAADEIVPLFALRKSVTLTGKHYMEQGLEKQRSEIETRMNAAVMSVLQAALG